MGNIKGWYPIKRSKSYKGELMLEASTRHKKIKERTIIKLWHDWENYWNVYVSHYPFKHDIKVSRSKNKKKAQRLFVTYMRHHPSG